MLGLAKVSRNGQVTVPIEVRRTLGVGAGDKILFSATSEGQIVVEAAPKSALRQAQEAFAGAAKEAGITSEDDVQRLIDEIRHGAR